jgi:hypothetical protein
MQTTAHPKTADRTAGSKSQVVNDVEVLVLVPEPKTCPSDEASRDCDVDPDTHRAQCPLDVAKLLDIATCYLPSDQVSGLSRAVSRILVVLPPPSQLGRGKLRQRAPPIHDPKLEVRSFQPTRQALAWSQKTNSGP